jgi:hypothetical protein
MCNLEYTLEPICPSNQAFCFLRRTSAYGKDRQNLCLSTDPEKATEPELPTLRNEKDLAKRLRKGAGADRAASGATKTG